MWLVLKLHEWINNFFTFIYEHVWLIRGLLLFWLAHCFQITWQYVHWTTGGLTRPLDLRHHILDTAVIQDRIRVSTNTPVKNPGRINHQCLGTILFRPTYTLVKPYVNMFAKTTCYQIQWTVLIMLCHVYNFIIIRPLYWNTRCTCSTEVMLYK